MLIVNSECDPQMILFFFPQIYCRFWSSHLGYKHTVSWMKHRISCLISVFWPFFWHSITPNFLTNVEYYCYAMYHWEWQISLCKLRCMFLQQIIKRLSGLNIIYKTIQYITTLLKYSIRILWVIIIFFKISGPCQTDHIQLVD